MALSRRNQYRLDIWPGFVDALTTLLMIIIFLLTVFVLAQFFLSEALSGRDKALDQLRSEMSDLVEVLALERKTTEELRGQVANLSGELQTSIRLRDQLSEALRAMELRATTAEGDAAKMASDIEALAALRADLEEKVKESLAQLANKDEQLITEKNLSETARAQVALLNQQLRTLREQIGQLSAALDASEKQAKDQQVQITNLGSRLNAALASRVQELTKFRSEFFGRLRDILGNQPGIRIVGDRFVFQSEVLFPSGSADLTPGGRTQIDSLARTLQDLARQIPPGINWVLRVDGHTDKAPIATPQFPSNWELSTARATAVVKALIEDGITPGRLAAAGFGEYQPLDPANTPAAYQRNRRIELKLDQR